MNKGEWSEFYVFLRLLGNGGIYGADSDLHKIESLYYPLVKVIREENKTIQEYIKSDNIINIVNEEGESLLSLPTSEFTIKAEALLKAIQAAKGSISVPVIEEFMSIIHCTKVKADNANKSDITVVLHDTKTLRNCEFGFSIKSRLGGNSTLLNASGATNFIYEVVGNVSDSLVKQTNSINSRSKVKDRLTSLYDNGCSLKFKSLESNIFNTNLMLIDSLLPDVLANYVVQYYLGAGKTVQELTELLTELNPCELDKGLSNRYYGHKIKQLLNACALGMLPATEWNGEYDATGGYIIVREDGEILCYHVYNHNEFQEYLLKNTYFDTPSSSRHGFGLIYKENDTWYMKLNAQVRFI